MPESGIVTSYDPRTLTGTLAPLTQDGSQLGESLPFHYDGGRFVSIVDDAPTFGDKARYKGTRIIRSRPPAVGDKLVFVRHFYAQQEHACPWVYAAKWQAAERAARSRREAMNSKPSTQF